jgi:hypothetical protein
MMEEIAFFADYTALAYHDARNVRHLVRAGYLVLRGKKIRNQFHYSLCRQGRPIRNQIGNEPMGEPSCTLDGPVYSPDAR